MKPILFNTEMVRAILEGRKTATRRDPFQMPADYDRIKGLYRDGSGRLCAIFQCTNPDDPTIEEVRARCQPGDILWVRETWGMASDLLGAVPGPVYRADYTEEELRGLREKRYRWLPSIHMPKEAARIFLRVTVARVERLRDMVLGDVLMEGIPEADTYEGTWDRWHAAWDRTIRPADRARYGWEANPWVWVIGFERINRKAALAAEKGDINGKTER